MNSLIPQGQEFSPQNMIEKAKRTLDGGYLVQIFYGICRNVSSCD